MTMSSYYYLPSPGEPLDATKEAEMLRVALALNAGSSVETLTDVLFDSLDGLVPFERIGVAVLSAGGVLSIAHVRSKLPIIWGKGASAPIAGTSLEPIVEERRIRIINDLEAYFHEHPHSRTAPLLLKEGMRASLTLPLTTPDGVVGLLFFSSSRAHAYGAAQVNFLRSLAAGIGIAFERAHLLDELRRSNDRLKTLDQLKTNFLSNLSHELRTPLSEVIGNAYALEDEVAGHLSSDQQGYLQAILTGGERLKTLLNDLFDFTALQAGQFVLNKIPMDLGALISEVAEEMRPLCAQKGLDLSIEVAQEPLVVEGDPPRLAQVVRALIDNAYKFTPAPGAVLVRAQADAGDVLVEIIDNGVGIPAEFHERVFDKFFQVESDANRTYGGTGLGLALVKAIVVAHGGLLLLRSLPGEGTMVSIRLKRSPT